MATFTKFQQFVEDLAHGVHDLENDQLIVALCAAANAPSVSADAGLGDVTEISYTDCSSRNITTASSGQTSGTYKLTLTDLTLTSSGTVGPFRYLVVYNNTPSSPADPLIAYFDYGQDLILADGESLEINFDDSNGLFDLA